MTDKNHQVVFEVPHEIIDAQVKAAVMKALHASGGAERLVQAVVEQAMAEQDRNAHYNEKDKSIFGAAIRKMIRDVAVEEFRVWLEAQREDIRRRIREALDKRKKEQVAALADRLLDTLSKAECHIWMKEER